MQPLPERLAAALADRYRLERELGHGGMATVYLAQDLKHDRKVAVKVLRPELAAMLGAERFVVEIRTTAALQHPNILPLFDSGSADGFLYYVMPYVEGETLRARLDRTQMLGVEEAVRLTGEVADALDHAHRHGVIHRDIKPENILLQGDRPLVADFGIALAVTVAAGDRMTESGLSLGTPSYMSPEQATAERQVTARSDIYSLASVLYEMLAGDPPHTGSSAQQIIMKIVTEPARPVNELRKSVPPHVAAAIGTALEKLPADRFDSAKAFAAALLNPAATPAGGLRVAGGATTASPRVTLRAAFAMTLLASAVAAWGWLRPGRATVPVGRFPTTLGADGTVDGITFGVQAAISPDGASLVYRSPLAGPGQLYLKRRGDLAGQPLAGTEGGSGPFFSPDGAWIGFVANGQLRRVPSTGGTSLRLADSIPSIFNRGAWLEDGSIVYYDVTSRVLRHLPAGGGAAKVIVSSAVVEGRFPWLPSPLPGSRGILFTAHLTECVGPVACRPSRVYVYDLRRDSVRVVFEDAIGAWYVPTGHVLFLTSAGTLMAAPWDNAALAPTGPPVPILDGIQAPGFLVSNEGTAYYVLGRPTFSAAPLPNATVVWVDRTGQVTPLDSAWQVNTGGTYDGEEETDWGLALSPDGRQLALTLLTDRGTDVWLKPLSSGPVTRLTLHPGIDRSPVWSPDGRGITFLSDRPASGDSAGASRQLGVWEQPADGTGEPRLLWGRNPAAEVVRSPDGRWLVLGTRPALGTSGRELLVARPGVDTVARRIIGPGSDAWGAALSPDGRWLAYVSNEPGTNEVFVRPFPDINGGKWQVSSGGGSAPLWSHSGSELFYVANGRMQVVTIRPGGSFSAEAPRTLFPIPNDVRAGGTLLGGTFAISPDDRRFLMVRDNTWQEMAGTPSLVVVQGFFDELRAKLTQR